MGLRRLLLFFFFLLVMALNPISPLVNAASNGVNYTAENPSPSPPTAAHDRKPNYSPFRPIIVVIIGVVTTLFSLTLLLLLYAKHCKTGNVVIIGYSRDYNHHHHHMGQLPPFTAKKNSGIDRVVVESLPIFRFGALTGQKDGLECAICLHRFEPVEVLRLLPKCKHAFHVECVDTWLDAHSTCPLCRYRVDPEDILLVDNVRSMCSNNNTNEKENDVVLEVVETVSATTTTTSSGSEFKRISGRHSSAGEKGGRGGFWQTMLDTTSFRRSLDGAALKKVSESESSSILGVGYIDRRKDGLLVVGSGERVSGLERSRLEHRIVVSPGLGSTGGGGGGSSGFHQRWSDVQPSDLLYLRSEMIISESAALKIRGGGGSSKNAAATGGDDDVSSGRSSIDAAEGNEKNRLGGRRVINSRSVSEITGLSRYLYHHHHHQQSAKRHHIDEEEDDGRSRYWRQGQAGVVSRWLAWLSSRQSRPAVRSGT